MNRMIPKTVVLLMVALAVVCAPFKARTQAVSPQQSQRPGRAGRAQGGANQASTANAAQVGSADAGSDVEQIPPQALQQTPIRVGIHNAMHQGVQAAKPNPAANLTLHTVNKNAVQGGASGTASTTPGGTQPNTAANTTQTVKQGGAANTLQNSASNSQTTGTTTQPPPQYRLAITAMQTAIGDLNKAGNKWGGHKGPAVTAINQALTIFGAQANQTGAANSAAADPSSAMQDAITQLKSAKTHLGQAANDWGGRKEKASTAIDQALSELQAGVDYAKSH